MTPAELQDSLAAELEALFSDYLLQTKTGERRAPHIYKQDVPVPTGDDEDEDVDEDLVTVPYIIVRLDTGTFDEWTDALHVGVIVVICTYDPTPDRQGAKDILGIITRIFRRFAANPHLGNFTCEVPIEWAIQSEIQTYPQFFGAMQLTFTCPGVRIEDPLA